MGGVSDQLLVGQTQGGFQQQNPPLPDLTGRRPAWQTQLGHPVLRLQAVLLTAPSSDRMSQLWWPRAAPQTADAFCPSWTRLHACMHPCVLPEEGFGRN